MPANLSSQLGTEGLHIKQALTPQANEDHSSPKEVTKEDLNYLASVVEKHKAKLIQIAKRNLGPALKNKLEPEDIIQTAVLDIIKNLNTHNRSKKLIKLRTPEAESELYKFLTVVIINKALSAIRSNRAIYRGGPGNTEQEKGRARLSKISFADASLKVSNGNIPDAMVFKDEVDRFRATLKPSHQEVLNLKLAEYKSGEISKTIGHSTRHVRRIVREIGEAYLQFKKANGENTLDEI